MSQFATRLLCLVFAFFAFAAPAGAQTKMISGFNNVYSPHMEFVSGRLKMYFGGWQTGSQVHDTIYRADCPNPMMSCASEGAVHFWDNGRWSDVPAGFEAINDPTVVNMGSYLIMYFTVCPRAANCMNAGLAEIHYAVSWAYDGLYWSAPTRLLSNAWLPSATRKANGKVLLYYNTGNGGQLRVTNLTTSGTNVASNRAVQIPGGRNYVNVEVRYMASLKFFQMLGEPLGGHAGIDYLDSADGLNFNPRRDRIYMPAAGQVKTRTPAMHPQTAAWTYFGSTARPDALENQIYFRAW